MCVISRVKHSNVMFVVQYSLSAPSDKRDLGGVLLLMCFIILKRLFWQLAPLIEEEVPEHFIFKLGFMQEARINGTWDDWVWVTKNYHKERAGMLRAAEGPVFCMAGLMPAHLVVARLLEPVHVRFQTTPY